MTVGSGFVDIINQQSQFFSGGADFSASIEGTTIREILTLSGTVDPFGDVSGNADSEAFLNGIPAGSGSASFTGTVNGNELSIQFPGGPLGVDGCSQSGALIEVATNCGNGFVDSNEECDDGNRDDGDGCSALCSIVPEPRIEILSVTILLRLGGLSSRRRTSERARCLRTDLARKSEPR